MYAIAQCYEFSSAAISLTDRNATAGHYLKGDDSSRVRLVFEIKREEYLRNYAYEYMRKIIRKANYS